MVECRPWSRRGLSSPRPLERSTILRVDDLALLERWRTGDMASGQTLFGRYFRDVYRFFQRKVSVDTDDLVQHTFAACVAGRDQFRGQSSFRTYVFAIARKQLYDYLRRQPKAEHVDFEVISIAEIVTSVAGKIDNAHRAERVQRALAKLPAEQQLLLELHYWHELDTIALAEVFETAPGTIRVRLLRARNALRRVLDAIAPKVYNNRSNDRMIAAVSEPEIGDDS